MTHTKNEPLQTKLTEDGHLDRGLGLLVPVLCHALVDAGAVHVGVVNGEGRRGFIAATHENVWPVGEDLLSAGRVKGGGGKSTFTD